jgi:hypothetical protein
MHDIDETLPDLMRRATDGLEPDSPDLVRRAMAKGVRLRRRRTAGLSIAAASALVLTGGVVVAAQSLGPDPAGAQVAGTPGLTVATATPSAKPVTPKDTLATLRKLLPATIKVAEPKTWGDSRFTAASVTVDDGKGLAEVSVVVEGGYPQTSCRTDDRRACQVLSDGSVVVSSRMEPVYQTGHPNDQGVASNGVELYRPDGVKISLQTWNSRDEKGSPKTRPEPPFSVAQLTSMARSPLWRAAPVVKSTYATTVDPDQAKLGRPRPTGR